MPNDSVFITPIASDRSTLLHAVPNIFFPWDKLLPDLQAQGKQGFTVEFADISAFGPLPFENDHSGERMEHGEDNDGNEGHVMYADRVPGLSTETARAAWGLFWFDGRIQIENTLRGQQANIDWVLSAEIAHAVDVYYAMNRGMRAGLNSLVHTAPDEHPWFGGDYWQQPGEAFMAGFGLAYTDFVSEDPRFLHRFTKAHAAQIRDILKAPRTDSVAPPPPDPGINWGAVTDDAFTAEYLRRFGDWAGIDIALTHRKGIVWRRAWKD